MSPNLACWCFQSCTCPGLSSRDDEPHNQWSDRWLGPLYPPGLSWLCHPCTPWLCVAAHPTLSSTCNWGDRRTLMSLTKPSHLQLPVSNTVNPCHMISAALVLTRWLGLGQANVDCPVTMGCPGPYRPVPVCTGRPVVLPQCG